MLIRNIAYSAALVFSLAQTALAEGAQVAFGGLKGDTTAQVEVNADTLTVNQSRWHGGVFRQCRGAVRAR